MNTLFKALVVIALFTVNVFATHEFNWMAREEMAQRDLQAARTRRDQCVVAFNALHVQCQTAYGSQGVLLQEQIKDKTKELNQAYREVETAEQAVEEMDFVY